MKPDNIFIDAVGDIKIGDFGLAKGFNILSLEKKEEYLFFLIIFDIKEKF